MIIYYTKWSGKIQRNNTWTKRCLTSSFVKKINRYKKKIRVARKEKKTKRRTTTSYFERGCPFWTQLKRDESSIFFRQSAIRFCQSAIISPCFSPKRDEVSPKSNSISPKRNLLRHIFSPKSDIIDIIFAKERLFRMINIMIILLSFYRSSSQHHESKNIHINLTITKSNLLWCIDYR